MAETTNSSSTPMTFEEKHKKLAELLEIFKRIREALGWGNNSSIVERMEELTQALADISEGNESNFNEIYDLVSNFEEKLNTYTPEEALATIDNIKEKTITLVEESFYNKQIGSNGLDTFDILPEKFAAEAKIVDCGKLKDNMLLAIVDNSVYEVTFDANDRHVEFAKSKIFCDSIIDNEGHAKEGYALLNKEGSSDAERDMMEAFAGANGFYFANSKEEAREMAEKMIENQMTPTIKFLSGRKDKIYSFANGRLESTFSSEDGTFRIRDTKTNELIVYTMSSDGLRVEQFEKANGFSGIGKPQPLASWEQGENGLKSVSKMRLADSATINAMLCSTEGLKIAETFGIDADKVKSTQFKEIYFESDKVNKDCLDKVTEFRDVIFKTMASRSSVGNSVEISNKKSTYINLKDTSGNALSIDFKKDGTPNNLRYRKNGEERKFVMNLNKKNPSTELSNLYGNKEFEELFHIVAQGYDTYTEQQLNKLPDLEKTSNDKKKTTGKDER